MATIDPYVLKHLSHMQPALYWLDEDPLEPQPNPTLIGDVTTDLCVVGAGYTGLWTALIAKEQNPEREVIIVEQRETGAGASGRNGGFCSYSLTHGFMNGYSRFKDEMAIIERLGRENLDLIEETIKRYGIDCQFEWTGELRIANEEWQIEGLVEEANLRNSFGDHVEVLGQEELVKRAHKYVVPVYDFQLVTEPLTKEQMKSIGWKGREGLSEAGNQFHYYRLTKDNEILWGGYDAIYNFRGKVRQEYETDAETYAHLAQAFLETFPQLKGVKFTHGWGGAIDTCSRFSPFWGKAYGGRVAYVLGYTGLGVGSTRFGAQVMLDLLDKVDNERTRLKMVRKKPLPFPPEPLKFIFIRITQWSINRADQNQGKRNLWLKLLDALGLGFDS